MNDIVIANFEKTKEEILVGVDRDSFFENWQENETWEVGFLVMKTKSNAHSFDLVDYESSVFWNGQEFIIKQMKDYAVGAQRFKEVVATHVYYTIQDGYQYEQMTGTFSINQCLSHIFSAGNRGFSYEVINTNGVFSRIEQENFGDGNYLKLIDEVLSDYDAVVIPDNKHLRFYPRTYYGNETQEQIRYKFNTDEVHFEIDTYSLKTQIRGFGKKKEDDSYYFSPITYTSPESSKWGIRIQDPVDDDRFTVASSMSARLRRDIHDYPDISGTVNIKWAIDLNRGDKVTFVYEPLNVCQMIQVVGLKKYPLIPNKPPEVTLSNNKKTMTNILAGLKKKGVL
ncbi:phage tail protein [Enterococcus dispar]|uniref:phage tail protein n=1 Tax=Enterococcus dispar TaxID=44009 RepID=UPI0021D46783|nr:phage tail protein [Enterococcus dispar]MCU7356521.1 phage tail protein [Enterococcus dispar]